MKQVIFVTIIALIGITFSANAGMKLKLRSDLSNERTATLGNHNFESNMGLKLPAELAPSGKMELLKGLFLIGLALDVSFPLGDFGDFWSTGFSAHAMVGYIIARSILLNLSVGYVKFSEKESNQGADISFSWIPLLFGLNYVFNPEQDFRPFIGLALGLYFFHSSFSFSFLGQTIDESVTNTEFGIAPRLGAYYLISAAMLLSLTAEYNLIFTEGSSTTALGILLGLTFALGN